MTSPLKCRCLRHVLIQIANSDPASVQLDASMPIKIRAVLANGRMVQGEGSKMSAAARYLLSQTPSFAGWQLAPMVNGDLSKATYRAPSEGSFMRLLQLTLPKAKIAPIPPVECPLERRICPREIE